MIRLMRLVATVYLGSILIGFFATAKVNSNIHENGLFYGDGWHLLGIQLGGTLFTIIFVAIMTWGCAKLITLIIPMRGQQTSRKRGPRSKRTRRKC